MTPTKLYYRRKYHDEPWKLVADLAQFLRPGGEHIESRIQEVQDAMGKLLATLVEKNILDVETAHEISGEGYLYETEFFVEGDVK